MKIFDPKLTGSIEILNTIQGNVTIAGGLTVDGSLGGSATTASYVEYTDVVNKPTLLSSSLQIASQISGSSTALSSSLSQRIASQEAFSSSLDATFATDAQVTTAVAGLNAASSSYLLNTTDTLTGTLYVNGSIGIGTSSPAANLQVNKAGGLAYRAYYGSGNNRSLDINIDGSNGDAQLTWNTTYNSGDKYFLNNYASKITSGDGLIFHVAPSGTSGDPISYTSAMSIKSSGNVGIGTTTVQSKLHVNAGAVSTPRGGGFTKFFFTDNNASTTYFEIQTPSTSAGDILFSDGSGGAYGLIGYDHSNDSMRIYTNSSPNVVVNSNGSVGVGATSPLRKLHVVGDLAVNAATTQYYGILLSGQGEGASPSMTIGDWHNASATIKWDSTNRYLAIDSQYSTSGAPIVFTGNDGASEYMRINSSGQLGIGTTAVYDSAKMELYRPTIWGTSNNRVINIQNTGYSGDIYTTHNMGSITWYSGNVPTAEIAAYRNVPASGNYVELNFYTAYAGVQHERMRITSDGLVGIGTSIPGYKLQSESGGVASYFKGGNGGYASVAFTGDNNTTIGVLTTWSSGIYFGRSNGTYGSQFGANADIFIKGSDGNVGLGTTSPAAKLHVMGKIVASDGRLASSKQVVISALNTNYEIYDAPVAGIITVRDNTYGGSGLWLQDPNGNSGNGILVTSSWVNGTFSISYSGGRTYIQKNSGNVPINVNVSMVGQ